MVDALLKKKAAGDTAVHSLADLNTVTRLYFGISEVAQMCQLENHVIRYWEKQFPMLSPQKRKGRRYFTKKDLLMVKQIKDLLYVQGFTIEGAREKLLGQNAQKMPRPEKVKNVVEDALVELRVVLDLLKA